MATSKHSNGFTGKLGKTVTYMLNGKMVQRFIGIQTKPPSSKRLPGMQVTKIVNDFLHPVKAFIKIGFAAEGKKAMKNAYSVATSYTRLNAIKGEYPDQQIDFEKVLFTKGDLPVQEEAAAEIVEGGVRFSWNPALSHPLQKPHDRSIMLAYSIDTGDVFYQLNGNRRQVGSDIILVPMFNKIVRLETYLAFISSDQVRISNSCYLGQLRYGLE